jgi:thiamine pyridinylase
MKSEANDEIEKCYRPMLSFLAAAFLYFSVNSTRTLKVSLYPYIPDARGAAWTIKERFEAEYPHISLKISFNSNYYDPGKGILSEDADVYELDSVFLADFVDKIQPLSSAVQLKSIPLVPFAAAAAIENNTLYGAPHWICGNFLIYRKDDREIAEVRNLRDLEKFFGSSPPIKLGLLIDLYGTSTLGEMYLDSLMDHYKSKDVVILHTDPKNIDQTAEAAIQRVLALVAQGFARDENYHRTTGFYARQFARGNGRALVGYSEQLYYALSESKQACRKDEKCLEVANIEVAEWPIDDEGSQPIAWVDMFVIDKRISGQKRADAETFINFMLELSTYKLLLNPDDGTPPRYLLSAREDVYAEVEKDLPHYADFRRAIDKAVPITDKGLNSRLRSIGHALNDKLPPH